MPRNPTECRRCLQARRLASFCFAGFALALVVSATDPAQDAARQAALLLCGMLAAVAIFRHPVARFLQMLVPGRTGSGARP